MTLATFAAVIALSAPALAAPELALSAGLERTWNDPFLPLTGPQFAASVRPTGWLGLGVRGAAYPDLGEAQWKPLTRQLNEVAHVMPDLSRIRARGQGVVELTPVRAALATRGGPAESSLGVHVGLGAVATRDDLAAIGADGDPVWEATAEQVHPAVSVALVGEVRRDDLGLRLRAEHLRYTEIVGGSYEERKFPNWFGAEIAWYGFGGPANE